MRNASAAIVSATMAMRNSRTLMASMADTPSGRSSVAPTLPLGAGAGHPESFRANLTNAGPGQFLLVGNARWQRIVFSDDYPSRSPERRGTPARPARRRARSCRASPESLGTGRVRALRRRRAHVPERRPSAGILGDQKPQTSSASSTARLRPGAPVPQGCCVRLIWSEAVPGGRS
jgi:hypothetical protein